MDDKESLRFNDRSIGDLIDQYTSEVSAESQFHHVQHPHDAQFRPHEDLHSRNNLYYQDGYPSHGHNSLPIIFNTGDNMHPNMMEVGSSNFMVYELPNTQRSNENMANLHYSKKTNGNLIGFNDYGVDYTGSDYNLFSGNLPPVQPHSQIPQFCQQAPAPKAQIIENLVGNWASNQSGTYSPFGSCLSGMRSPVADDPMGLGRGCKRTRIVAEVKPMRPSYSDVLAKSITNSNLANSQNQKQNNKNSQDMKQKPAEPLKTSKANKASAVKSCNGSGGGLCRHNSAVLDDQSFIGLRHSSFKKSETDIQDGLSKKWMSLDDLKDACQGEFISIGKKSSPKPSTKRQHKTGDKVDNIVKGTGMGKQQTSKKDLKPKDKASRDQEVKTEPGKCKPGVREADDRRAGSQSKTDSHKAPRRNSRQAEKHAKASAGRGRRRDQEPFTTIMKHHLDQCWGFLLRAIHWLVRLVVDVLGMSTHLAIHMFTVVWVSTVTNTLQLQDRLLDAIRNIAILQRITSSKYWPFKRKEKEKKRHDSTDSDEEGDTGATKGKAKLPRGLKNNIPLPATGEEAMKRLLACKGKDPYSILGVTQDCTDDDIKKYYKRQAFLVHPDKNNQPGAEEAFKILVHAFDIIGEPEHRKSYDRRVEKTQQVEHAWSELSDLLSKLHKKMEHVANTIRCTNCGKRHKRIPVDRPVYAARMCSQCKIHHSAREGDIWAETSLFGIMWHYYACMDGAVHDVTEWAGCQGGHLRNLKANTHNVQYRIVLDKQRGQKHKFQQATPTGEPDLEDFLSNLYTKTDTGASPTADADLSSGGTARKRKAKRKK